MAVTKEDVLRSLPPDTIEYPYLGTVDMEAAMDFEYHKLMRSLDGIQDQLQHRVQQANIKSEYVVFTGIPLDIFDHDLDYEKAPESPVHKEKLDLWKGLGVLVITMRTKHHILPVRMMEMILYDKLKEMGVNPRRTLLPTGDGGVEGLSRKKQPDASFMPVDLPQGRSDKWPSVTLEVGLSGSERQLEKDAKWWLQESDGAAKLALTMKVDQREQCLTIKVWEKGPGDSGPQSALLVLTRSVSILGSVHPHEVVVRNGPIVLPFRKIFLRDPVGEERDVVLDEQDLTDLARALWRRSREFSNIS